MSDDRLPAGRLPGATRPPFDFHSSRRHVDLCRTAGALCRA